MQELIQHIFAEATRLGVCERFTGTEDRAQLFELFFSPQGIEFCQANQFPDRETMRRLKACGAEAYGIYIDAGPVTLHNPARVALIGDTTATLSYDKNARHEVILLHDAQADITATDWAVVFVTNKCGCEVATHAHDYAKIL